MWWFSFIGGGICLLTALGMIKIVYKNNRQEIGIDKKDITEETIAMNERLKKLEGETKSSLILSIMKCKDFHYNKWLNK